MVDERREVRKEREGRSWIKGEGGRRGKEEAGLREREGGEGGGEGRRRGREREGREGGRRGKEEREGEERRRGREREGGCTTTYPASVAPSTCARTCEAEQQGGHIPGALREQTHTRYWLAHPISSLPGHLLANCSKLSP